MDGKQNPIDVTFYHDFHFFKLNLHVSSCVGNLSITVEQALNGINNKDWCPNWNAGAFVPCSKGQENSSISNNRSSE